MSLAYWDYGSSKVEFMKRSSSGPRMDPWETPEVTEIRSDETPLSTTRENECNVGVTMTYGDFPRELAGFGAL